MDFIVDQDDVNEFFQIYTILREVSTVYDHRSDHLGITRMQSRVLRMVQRYPGIRQAELAKLLEVEPITVVRQIDRMQQKGWVKRKVDPADRRANKLYVTEVVAELLDNISVIAVKLRKDVLAGFSAEEHATMLSYFKRIQNNLEPIKAESNQEHA